jgi:hypothetical protein
MPNKRYFHPDASVPLYFRPYHRIMFSVDDTCIYMVRIYDVAYIQAYCKMEGKLILFDPHN